MLFTPFSILGMWVRGLLSLAILAGGAFLLYRWYQEVPGQEVVETVFLDGRTEPATEVRQLHSFRERLSAWQPGFDSTTALLSAGLFLMLFSVGGRLLLSPRWLRRAGPDEPQEMRTGESRRIHRPDGTQLHVEFYGPLGAQPLVLTHGWGCDSSEWYYLKRQLADRYRLIVWDLPECGRSTRPENNDYSLEKMASDLRAVLDVAGDQPAILLSHSIGGMINLTFCRLFPALLGERVSAIIIAHSTSTNPLKTMLFGGLWTALQKPLIEPLLYLTIWLSPLLWVMNCLSYLNGSAHWSTEWQSFAGTETRGQLDFATRYLLKASPAIIARGTLGMLRYDATAVLETIDVPVLVIAGDRDPVTRPEASRHIKRGLPDGHLIIMKPAKHLGLLEHHEEFARVTNNFWPGDREAVGENLGQHLRRDAFPTVPSTKNDHGQDSKGTARTHAGSRAAEAGN